jgi:1-phosphatidylinositol-3-phosphate 5-kinase
METVATSAEAGGIPISASGSSVNAPSILSEGRSELSFTDRLQIELPQFETCAPLPSVPATTQPSADTGVLTADESARNELGQVSQMSEGEMSSGGERSSILKTLTGLWAFRAGDYSPLEYPLSAAEHLFTDSRVIIRENEPTSIIAFTLSAKPYRDKMRNNRFQTSRKVETFMPEDTMPSDRASTWDIVSLDEAMDTDEPSKHEGGTHLKYGECERVVERGRLR